MSSIFYFLVSLVFLVAYSHAGMALMGPVSPGPMGPAKDFIGAPHPGLLFDGPAPYPVGPVAYNSPFPYGFPNAYYGRGVAAVRNVAQDYHREDARRVETSMVVPAPHGGYLRKA